MRLVSINSKENPNHEKCLDSNFCYPRIKYTCVLEDPYGDNNGSDLT